MWRAGRARWRRVKAVDAGAAALSDAELLAIFLRTGLPGVHVMQLAEQLLRRFGSLYHLMSADHQAFAAKRPGDASYTQLQAIAELALRFFPAICRRKTPCSIRASPGIICKACWRIASERSFGIVLDNQHRVIRHQEMFAGTISSVVVYREKLCAKR